MMTAIIIGIAVVLVAIYLVVAFLKSAQEIKQEREAAEAERKAQVRKINGRLS